MVIQDQQDQVVLLAQQVHKDHKDQSVLLYMMAEHQVQTLA
jgi:hypothetical protein